MKNVFIPLLFFVFFAASSLAHDRVTVIKGFTIVDPISDTSEGFALVDPICDTFCCSDQKVQESLHGRITGMSINNPFKEGKKFLVQICKEPIGSSKGARLTCHITLPCCNIVFMLKTDICLSPEIEGDEPFRKPLNSRLAGTGTIVETAEKSASPEEELVKDREFLLHLLSEICDNADKAKPLTKSDEDLEIILWYVWDIFAPGIDFLVVDDHKTYERILKFVKISAPHLRNKVHFCVESSSIFDVYGMEVDINPAMDKKTSLRCGDYKIIDAAEVKNIKPSAGVPAVSLREPEKNKPVAMIKLQKTRDLILNGREREAERIITETLRKYSSPESRAEIRAAYADNFARLLIVKPDNKNLENQAERLYKSALLNLKGNARAQTINNYGSLLIRRNKNKEALKVLQSVEVNYDQETDKAKKAAYYYNLGRAYEENGDFDKAGDTFQRSAMADPAFSPASRAVNRILSRIEPDSATLDKTTAWLNDLVAGGDLSLARKSLELVFADKKLVSHDGFEQVFIPMIRYLTESRTDTEHFSILQKKLPPNDLLNKESQNLKREVAGAYFDDFVISFKPGSGLKYIRNLMNIAGQTDDKVVVGGFLKMIGDTYRKADRSERALQRYAVAWTSDTTNMEAAYAAVSLLFENSDRLKNANKILDEFINNLFEIKGQAYRAQVGEDWQNIFRFHLVLGSIYVQKKIWGNSWNARSAVFQFEHAVKAHERQVEQKKNKSIGRIAGVKMELARIYMKAGEREKAIKMYFSAAQSALDEKDTLLALEIIENGKKSVRLSGLSNRYIEKFTIIEKKLKSRNP